MNENISTEEKIDYIYNILKKNERKALFGAVFKWGFRLFIIGYMIYFIKVDLPLLIDSLIPDMPDFGDGEGVGVSTDQIKDIISNYFPN
ncbi:hypothetical protein LR010_01020 [Candidatus Gracilibacteria bacterium]|nr:hypothetical protein [Candidatus Gracilibacteria bacterium]